MRAQRGSLSTRQGLLRRLRLLAIPTGIPLRYDVFLKHSWIHLVHLFAIRDSPKFIFWVRGIFEFLIALETPYLSDNLCEKCV